jgi:hypothetical protein
LLLLLLAAAKRNFESGNFFTNIFWTKNLGFLFYILNCHNNKLLKNLVPISNINTLTLQWKSLWIYFRRWIYFLCPLYCMRKAEKECVHLSTMNHFGRVSSFSKAAL